MILSAEDLSYSYGDRLLFENITFSICIRFRFLFYREPLPA